MTFRFTLNRFAHPFSPTPRLTLVSTTLVAVTLAVFMGVSPDAMAQEAKKVDPKTIRYAPGQVLVQPRAGLTMAEFDKILGQFGGKRIGQLKQINVHIVQLPAAANAPAVVEALSRNKQRINFAELNQVVEPVATLSDPDIAKAWQLAKIGAPAAWDQADGNGILLADCDTGVDPNHPDLNLAKDLGWNTVSNNTEWADLNGHGTATSGAMAEIGNNAIGAAGPAYKAQIIPVRVSNDSGGSAYLSDLAECVTYAADKGARGANLSYSGVCGSSTVFNAASYLRNKTSGIVVAAASNTGTELTHSPSNLITCVSATDSSDRLTSWSSYGNYVDVAAPGQGIYTTLINSRYGTISGTSFSSPITMGVYALMMQANPQLTPSQLDEILFSTAQDLGVSGWDKYFGHGRINAAAAVAKAKSLSGSDSTAPSLSFSSPSNNAKVSGSVPVDITATDNVGVSSVTLRAGTAEVGTVSTPTNNIYPFVFDTNGVNDGPLTLTAEAIDEAGNKASTQINITIANDTVPPTVAFNAPQSGSKVNGTVEIKVTATDNKAISRIVLFIDNKQVYQELNSTELGYSWVACTAKGSCKGTSSLRATAYDTSGNSTSTAITVTKSR